MGAPRGGAAVLKITSCTGITAVQVRLYFMAWHGYKVGHTMPNLLTAFR